MRQLPKKKLPPDPVGDDDCTDENDITIIVSGLLPSTSKDAVVNYFENSRRSGGGEVSNFHYTDDGEAIITLLEVKGMCDSAFCLSYKSTYVLYVMRCQKKLRRALTWLNN